APLGTLLYGARSRRACRSLKLSTDRAEEMHHAFLGLPSCPLVGLGDVHRHAQIDFSVAGMACGALGLTIKAYEARQRRKRAEAGRDEDRVTHGSDRSIGIAAGGGDANRRIRLLSRLRDQ